MAKTAAPHRWHEIIGILLLALGLLLTVSLISYAPEDPSFSTVANISAVHNLAGRVGSYLADGAFQLIGGSAYLVALLSMWIGWRRFLDEPIMPSRARAAGLGALLLLFTTLLDMWVGDLPALMGGTMIGGAGGIVGRVFALLLEANLNWIGANIVLVAGVLAALVFTTRVSLSRLGHALTGWAKRLGTWAATSFVIYREQSRRLRTRLKAQPRIADAGRKKIETAAARPEAATAMESAAAPAPAATPPLIRQPPKGEPANFDIPKVTTHGEYQLPPLTLLADPPAGNHRVNRSELLANAQILERKLLDYDIEGRVAQVHPGPVITMYEFEPAAGVKVSKIANLSDDLALAMSAMSVRIVAPIPGKSVVGIEIPNVQREDVYLKEILASDSLTNGKAKLALALGKDIFGVPVVADLATMPHLLVAGATGSGKSVCLNSMILSLLFTTSPQDVKFIMIDPKLLELSVYDGIPHLMSPVIVRPKDATAVFARLVSEMQYRYKIMAEAGVRNIDGYNKKMAERKTPPEPPPSDPNSDIQVLPPPMRLPYLVVIVDELADLMMVAGKKVEELIARLAQMARAAGIHLVLATQRPSVDVITGLIKANFPARISFQVASKTDSRTILDANGAEQLLGRGDMLYMSTGTNRFARIHGAYVSDGEIRKVVEFCKQQAKPQYIDLVKPSPAAGGGDGDEDAGERDELYEKAIDIVVASGSASASLIQRRLRVGYPRAARMIEMMEEDGIVGPAAGGKPREVLKQPSDRETMG